MQQLLHDVVGVTNEFLWSKLLVIMLVSCGIYFTFKLKFVQVRMLKEMVRVLMEGRTSSKDSVSPISSFLYWYGRSRWNR